MRISAGRPVGGCSAGAGGAYARVAGITTCNEGRAEEDTTDVERVAEALTRLGERKLTWPVLCERAGVEHAIGDRLWRALGFPDVPRDEPAYTADDVRALRLAAEGIETLEGEERDRALEFIVREARTVSGYLARIAETEVDSFAERQALHLRDSARAEALEHGIERSPLGWLIMYVLRRRLDEAIRRRGSTEAGAEPELAVGFVDLVDFTRASTGLDAAEFGRVLGAFEALAWDEVTEAGGRLVKLVGDEAMFVCPPTADAAMAAIRILDQCGRDGRPHARAGLAAGPVLIRGGDYFGPVVNLASRLVDAAQPDTIVVNESYQSLVAEEWPELSLEAFGSRDLKGIGMTKLWQLKQSADSPAVDRPQVARGAEAGARRGQEGRY
jgi:adenylate cyclase